MMPRTMYEIAISRGIPRWYGVRKSREIRKAGTNPHESYEYVEFMLVEQRIYLSCIFRFFLMYSCVCINPLIYSLTNHSSICGRSFDIRSTIDSFLFAASALTCLFFGLPNRSSQLNFKLFREFLISKKIVSRRSFVFAKTIYAPSMNYILFELF